MSDTIHVLLGKVMSDVLQVKKKSRVEVTNGPKYNFRGVDAVVNAVGPVLRLYRVVVVPDVQSVSYQDVETGKARTPGRAAMVTVKYRFIGPLGDEVTATVAAEAIDSGDKATAKAMAVAWRTCLVQVLAIPTGDPDPDSASYERSEPYTAEELGRKALMKTATREMLLQLHQIAKQKNLADKLVKNEHGEDESVGDLIVRRGQELPVARARRRTIPDGPEPVLVATPLNGGSDE